MGKNYIKQDIRKLLQNSLLAKFGITTYGQVDRYTYATKLGSLEHIDYAIPLFGYASQANKEAPEIYGQLEKVLSAQMSCKTEFVNGYANIMLSNDLLEESLKSHQSEDPPKTSDDGQPILIIRTSSEAEAVATTKLIHECLEYTGIDSLLMHPYPPENTASGQYWLEEDAAMRQLLAAAPGIVHEPNSKAMYLKQGSESHALCSVKGGWFPLSFIVAAILEHRDKDTHIFAIGSSEVNKLVRTIFDNLKSLDTDVHAKHINSALHRSVSSLANKSLEAFKSQSIKNMPTKQRRELLYILDFKYEIGEAAKLGDLKRMVGEITTLIEQHPLSDVA